MEGKIFPIPQGGKSNDPNESGKVGENNNLNFRRRYMDEVAEEKKHPHNADPLPHFPWGKERSCLTGN